MLQRLIKFHNRKLMLHAVGNDEPNCTWRLWLNANADFTLGTYLQMSPDGKLHVVTVRNGEGDDVQELTMDKVNNKK